MYIGQLKPIITEEDYENSLKTIENFFDNQESLTKGEEHYFEALGILIEDYENKNFPIPQIDPIEAIKFRMEQLGLEKKDLVGIIGNQNRVYEVLNKKRNLSLKMIKNLHNSLNIPYENLFNS